MKRLVNLRVSLLCVVSFVFGVLSFHEFLFGNILPLVLFLTSVFIATVVLACFKNKLWLCALCALVVFTLGFFNFYRVYQSRREWDNSSLYNATVCGRVSDIGRNGEVQNVLYLEDCTVNGNEIKGRIKIAVYDGAQFFTGDVLQLDGTLRKVYAVRDDVDTRSIRYNVTYELTDVLTVSQSAGKLNLGETVRVYVYNVTKRYMPQNADVGYALLTGDRNALEESKRDAFVSAGIMHLLVVSGLHVGFVVSVFGFVLRRLKLNPLFQLLVLLVPMSFYAYICDFSPSVVRAVVMTVCLFVSRFLRGKYDLLSSLCWAAFFILIVQPLYLYDLGFQLSVMSVLGIATVYLQIDRKLRKKKLYPFVKKILSTVTMSFSCVCATFFLSANSFGQVAILGIVVNVVAIPAVFVAFVLSAVGLLPWVFRYALRLADFVLQGVVEAAKFSESLNVVLPVQAVTAGVAVSLALLLVVGGYVNMKRFAKVVSYVVCFALLACCVAASYVPSNCKNSVSVFSGYNDTVIVATSEQNQIAVVADFDDGYAWANAKALLVSKRVTSAVLYVTRFCSCNFDVVKDVCQTVCVKHVVVMDFTGNDVLDTYFRQNGIPVYRVLPNEPAGDYISVQAVYNGGLTASVVRVGGVSVAAVYADGVKAKDTVDVFSDVDYFVYCDEDFFYSGKNVRSITRYQHDASGNFGANKYGNFTIGEKDGKILLSFRRTTQ